MISMRTALAATLTAFIGSSVGLAQTEPGLQDDVSKATTDSLCNRYALLVETVDAAQDGMTTYLMHWTMPEEDRLSAMFGTDLHPLTLVAPEGVFNSPYNGSWSASGMNPRFFEVMPTMKDDTYATIGLQTGAKASGLAGAEDPTMVQDPGEPWDVFFVEDGETHLNIATHTGGSWFVLRTASNGAPVDGKVFIAQITTKGSISGAINAQFFPAIEGVTQAKCRCQFEGPGVFQSTGID